MFTPRLFSFAFLIAIFVCKPTYTAAQTADEFVPEWSKSAIWYQVFPERFRDGDPSNNPTVEDIKGADPQEKPKVWEIHPWGSDWYELQPYELTNGEPEMWKHMLRRRYGGDLQGIIDRLDYIQEIGATAIYLNPIFQSPSLHKYDGVSYHHVDPNFGPDPIGDRKMIAHENLLDPSTWVWTSADLLALQLIEEVHNRGMKIIFDGVFNHMGYNSVAFQDVMKNQASSPYKDWFYIKSFEDKSKGIQFDYEGWFGVKSLPELREDSNGIVHGPREYIFAATERWMNPQNKGHKFGIDGWRLDVAFCVDHHFWKDWRVLVKELNPEAYLTAEIVDKPEKVQPYMQGDEFDGEMNYNFAFTCSEFFFNPEDRKISPSEFDQRLAKLRNLYPIGVAYASQNLFGSHDANRIGSHIMNTGIGDFRDWGTYFNKSQVGSNPEYNFRKPNERAIELQKLFVIMQMTYVGAPMIYYGDEVGMWGANDPDCRKPMVWEDLVYANETHNPDQSLHDADVVCVNQDLLDHYRKLANIRKYNSVLSIGDYETILMDDDRDLFGFKRSLGDSVAYVVLNNSENGDKVQLRVKTHKIFIDLLSGEMNDSRDGVLQFDLAGKSGAIWIPYR